MSAEQSNETRKLGSGSKPVKSARVLLTFFIGYGLALVLPAISVPNRDFFFVAALETIPWSLLAPRELGARFGRNNAFNLFFGFRSLVAYALLNATADVSTKAFVFPIIFAGQIFLIFAIFIFDGFRRLLRK